ncbi:katanin p80 WD40 repeat-containing subunit B1 homolog KTN80.4-like isoform X2 [Hibiscus syriacus]|uniref:katanin p80 WD40 repeat-containing subunit B1 homolog KTN80.4-like isoform X2 n=1 Tax=Hibiscus syriacus TaxID=106335 RepID=UPI001924DBA5|nr:katanin p80 WD40 repeat-containing subunit B1 homolog KTN80.4-like isoform X2 [Hibiscus syriacus]
MSTKRAYKLQEFVAHSSSVNCLKIGKKSSRVLVTGGEDHKVNLWAIGKPNAILSLPGHTSGIDSVSFDSSEVLVAAGAASGTIKLWNLEEAKIVRTLTGHRSNCISVDFHPFGEFFASGSLDTNLKIWDIRKKGCIHTYKGHTRGVNVIRFTPDGRWVVSGGEDNIVKVWDLTAGKLLHQFKDHEGQIQCLDFHPHEFLLATGSADRTVKFWDLETFELIGSAGPETTGVRCLTFNPDGRTVLCGLHENMKVFSWEPVRCHDGVDVGWSKLSDLNVHEGKLLGCSYNQSCVGVWIVDISRIEAYAVGNAKRVNGHSEPKSRSGGNLSVLNENTTKASMGRLPVSQNPDPLVKETKSLGRLSISQNSDPAKESKTTRNLPGTPHRVNLNTARRTTQQSLVAVPSVAAPKRSSARANSAVNVSTFSKSDFVPVVVPRNDTRVEQAAELRKEVGISERSLEQVTESRREVGITGRSLESSQPVAEARKEVGMVRRTSEQGADSRKELGIVGRTMPFSLQSKTSSFRNFQNSREDMDQPAISALPETAGSKAPEFSSVLDRSTFPSVKGPIHGTSAAEMNAREDGCIGSVKSEPNSVLELPSSYRDENYDAQAQKSHRDAYPLESRKGVNYSGRTHSVVINWEKRRYNFDGPSLSISSRNVSVTSMPLYKQRRYTSHVEKEMPSATDEYTVADVMEPHDQFIGSMQSRLAKLQVVRRLWERNDIKGAINAMEKMADHAVLADVISIITEKMDIVTLEICTCLLPLLSGLLGSNMDRHLSICLDMLLKLVWTFGSMICSTVSALTPTGVDIEAEQRFERCNLCFIELERVKQCLPVLTRGGSVAKSAQELNLALQEVS